MTKKYKNGDIRLSRAGHFILGSLLGLCFCVICCLVPTSRTLHDLFVVNFLVSIMCVMFLFIMFEDTKLNRSYKFWFMFAFFSPIPMLYVVGVFLVETWKAFDLNNLLFETVGEKEKHQEKDENEQIKDIVEEAVNHLYYRHQALDILKGVTQEEIDSAVDVAFKGEQ